MNLASTFAAASVLAIAGAPAHARDGRTGPLVFTGAALDSALSDLNGFAQKRYAIDDARGYIGHTSTLPHPVPVYVKGAPVGFGPAISDGASDVPYVTGASFDAYVATLMLY